LAAHGEDTHDHDDDHHNESIDDALLSIYEHYAALYPNALLLQEYQQRDYL
jgi:hypothetical protein